MGDGIICSFNCPQCQRAQICTVKKLSELAFTNHVPIKIVKFTWEEFEKMLLEKISPEKVAEEFKAEILLLKSAYETLFQSDQMMSKEDIANDIIDFIPRARDADIHRKIRERIMDVALLISDKLINNIMGDCRDKGDLCSNCFLLPVCQEKEDGYIKRGDRYAI